MSKLNEKEKKQTARRILSPILFWMHIWGQSKYDLNGEPYGMETLLFEEFCRLTTPDNTARMFVDDFINPIKS